MTYNKGDYEKFHASPKAIKERASRNKAVKDMGRKGKASKDGKEIDHIDGNPLNNTPSNRRVVKRTVNRKKQ